MPESDEDTTDLEFVEFLLVHIEGSPSFVSIQKGLNERVPPGSHTWRFCTDILQKEINRLNQQLAEAQAIVDKLPKTADGVVVMPGGHIFLDMGNGEIKRDTVIGVHRNTLKLDGNESGIVSTIARFCYSTREAAQAALDKGEG